MYDTLLTSCDERSKIWLLHLPLICLSITMMCFKERQCPDHGQVHTQGLNMLYGPGNDLVSATALTAAGAHLILFTTGRGTPFGAPAPTMKLSTNTPLAQKKFGWIDFNAGTVADGAQTLEESADDLMSLVLEIASGKQTKAEQKGFREISIFKDGVVL